MSHLTKLLTKVFNWFSSLNKDGSNSTGTHINLYFKSLKFGRANTDEVLSFYFNKMKISCSKSSLLKEISDGSNDNIETLYKPMIESGKSMETLYFKNISR